jgi:anti-anti-sigma factor
MTEIAPPSITRDRDVTIVNLGPDYSNLFQNMVHHLDTLTEVARTAEPPQMLINLEHVRFMGSAMLGQLISIHKQVTARENGRFGLTSLNSYCATVIASTSLDQVFELFDSQELGVEAFSGKD